MHFAWPTYRNPWECDVVSVVFDGADRPDAINPDHLRIDAHETDWNVIEVAMRVSTGESVPSGIDGVAAHVLVACRTTQLRRAYPLIADGKDGRFAGTVSIPRTVLGGKAEITVEVVGAFENRRRAIGCSLPWSIIVDRAEAPPRPGIPPLPTVWVDFAATDAPPPARRYTGSHAYVDVTACPPVLYLNRGVEGLQQLILSDTAKRERRRWRDMLGASIARYVANSLFRTAVEQVIPGEDEMGAQGPDGRIFRDVCEAVAAELPDTETVDDLYDLIASLPGNPGRSAEFWADVDLALDRMTSVSTTIAQICEEVRRV